MDIFRGQMVRIILSQTLFSVAALFVALAITLALQINDPQQKMLIVGCCAVPAMLIHMHFAGARCLREIQQQAEDEEREWDCLVNAGCRNSHDTPESN